MPGAEGDLRTCSNVWASAPEQQQKYHHRQTLDLLGNVVHVVVEIVGSVRPSKVECLPIQ
jgi:hypothetical protein